MYRPAAMIPFVLQIYSFQFVVLLLCAVAYYKGAEIEGASGLWWSAISVALFLLTWNLLGWGWLACLLGQLGLVAAITLVRVIRNR